MSRDIRLIECEHAKPFPSMTFCNECSAEYWAEATRLGVALQGRPDFSELKHCARCDQYQFSFCTRYCDKCEEERARPYRHGLTLGQAEDLLEAQGGHCPVCGKAISLRTSHIDHDHSCCVGQSCGKCVRGIVDARCNTLLGYLETTPRDVLDRAFEFIAPRLRAVA